MSSLALLPARARLGSVETPWTGPLLPRGTRGAGIDDLDEEDDGGGAACELASSLEAAARAAFSFLLLDFLLPKNLGMVA